MRNAVVACSLLALAWAACEGSTPKAASGGHTGSAGSAAAGSGPNDGAFPSGSSGQLGAAGIGVTGGGGQLGQAGSGVAGSFIPCPATPPATDLFLPTQAIGETSDQRLGPVALGDLDGDGSDDLVVGGHVIPPPGAAGNSGSAGSSGMDTGSIEVALAAPGKVFAAALRYDGFDPYLFGIGDVTGDKRPDLVVLGPSAATMLPNTGAGALGAPTPSISMSPGFISALALADLDGDGKAELVLGARYTNGPGVVVRAWDGASGFQTALNLDGGANVMAIAVGDVDGHAGADLVAANEAGTVHVFLNDGAGHFGTPTVIDGYLTTVSLADVDGDGKQDIIGKVSAFKDGYVVLTNLGDGHFAAIRSLPIGDGSGEAAFGDIDGDGKVDAVVSSNECKTLLLYQNDGTGGFSAPKTIAAAYTQFALGDVNGDKAPDVVLLARGGVLVQLHRKP